MQFLIIAYDGIDAEALNRRLAARSVHIELGDKLRDAGHLHFATAILDDSGKMIGSMLVAEYESREELDAWLNVEPYVTGKVWESIEVRPCRVGPSFVRK
jgi:uncharacterized protein YciI